MSSTLTATLHTVVMPSLGEQLEEGTVTRWLKQPGNRIEIGDPLLEVTTDKVDTEGVRSTLLHRQRRPTDRFRGQ